MSNTIERPKLPEVITFTGADDGTDAKHLLEMHEENESGAPPGRPSIEFGILFSPSLTGQPRYPSAQWVSRMMGIAGGRIKLAAHICGGYSRELLETGTIRQLAPLLAEGAFGRVQINTADPRVLEKAPSIADWGSRLNVKVILQSRDPVTFPAELPGISWLYDASGGRGILPAQWPQEFGDRLVGNAGGLNSKNISHAVRSISTRARRYWVDLETGARDENDRFAITTCREICRIVGEALEGA